MSVLLTSAIYIDSVLTPVGTTVSLGYQREQAIVSSGEGTWVSIPTIPTPPAAPSLDAFFNTARTGFPDPVTGLSLIPEISPADTWCLLGDSLTANNNVSTSIPIGGAVRLNGIVTVTLTSHILQTNQNLFLSDSGNTSSFGGRCTITRTGVNTFTFPQAGPDETSTVLLSVTKQELMSSKSWWQRANMAVGGKWRLLNNAGGAGQTSAMILARIDRDVIAYAPDWCSVLAGTNDVNTDISAATITANLQAIYNKLLGAGIKVVAITIPPHNGTYQSYYSIARNQVILAVNSWIRRKVASTPNMVLADFYAALIDTTSVNGYGVASYYITSDELHIGANGASVCGAVLNTAVSKYTFGVSPLIQGPADTSHAVTASAATNENKYSGGWAASGTTATGTGMSCDAAQATTCRDPAWLLSTGGGGAQTCVAKLVARADGRGYDQQLTLTAAASGDNFTARSNYNTTPSGTLLVMNELVAGATYEAVFDVNLTGVAGQNVDYIQSYVQMSSTFDVAGTQTAVNNIVPAGLLYGGAGDGLAADVTGPVRIRFTMPPFTAIAVFQVYFTVQFSGAGSCVLKLGAGSVRQIA